MASRFAAIRMHGYAQRVRHLNELAYGGISVAQLQVRQDLRGGATIRRTRLRSMKRTLSAAALVLALLFLYAAIAQDKPALVTFYSVGCIRCVKGLGAGSVEMAYRGAIYDGDVELVKTMMPNRFVTLQMKAGPHSFGGSNPNGWKIKRDENEGRHLQLMLLPARHYFIRFAFMTKGVYIYRHFSPIPTQRECSEAFSEGAQTEPLKPKGLDKRHLMEVLGTPYFPVCEAVAAPNALKNLP
jgi:hypothetical protein